MNIITETRRLLIRTFTTLDANLIYELNRDPDVTLYSQDVAHASEILRKPPYRNMLCIIMADGLRPQSLPLNFWVGAD